MAFKILKHRIELTTIEPIQIVDITQTVRDWAGVTGIREGLLTVLSLIPLQESTSTSASRSCSAT